MKRGVVLSGGGTKGAFEAGVWRALLELNIDYQIVTGTSIGSINGALMSMLDFERCEKMWLGMEMGDLLGMPAKKKSTMADFMQRIFSPAESMRERMGAGSVDNSPFPEFIQTNIDEDAIRRSPVDYGLVTVRSRDRKAFSLAKKDIPEGLLRDYIIASSSVYPIFPMHKIGDEFFIDGMYHDNLPIDLCVSMGAEELVVVDLHQKPQHPDYASRPYVTYITPSEDLGGVLAFNPEKIRKNVEMGYRDAMRTFGRYKGYVYSFLPESLKIFGNAAERFNMYCVKGQAAANLNAKKKLKKPEDLNRMFRLLEEYSRGRAVQKEDYFIRGAEIAAEICGLSHEKIWDMSDLTQEVLASIGSAENYPDRELFRPGITQSIHRQLKELQKTKGSAYLLGCLRHSGSLETVDYELMREILMTLPREMAACFFVRSVTA